MQTKEKKGRGRPRPPRRRLPARSKNLPDELYYQKEESTHCNTRPRNLQPTFGQHLANWANTDQVALRIRSSAPRWRVPAGCRPKLRKRAGDFGRGPQVTTTGHKALPGGCPAWCCCVSGWAAQLATGNRDCPLTARVPCAQDRFQSLLNIQPAAPLTAVEMTAPLRLQPHVPWHRHSDREHR